MISRRTVIIQDDQERQYYFDVAENGLIVGDREKNGVFKANFNGK